MVTMETPVRSTNGQRDAQGHPLLPPAALLPPSPASDNAPAAAEDEMDASLASSDAMFVRTVLDGLDRLDQDAEDKRLHMRRIEYDIIEDMSMQRSRHDARLTAIEQSSWVYPGSLKARRAQRMDVEMGNAVNAHIPKRVESEGPWEDRGVNTDGLFDGQEGCVQ